MVTISNNNFCGKKPLGSNNLYTNLIAKNPPTSFNCKCVYPTIDNSSFIGPFSSVIGDVRIDKDVYIANDVSLRADEGTPFYIGVKSNIQDGVKFHGLKNKTVRANNKEYSIYIGREVSIAHGTLIHGPCKIDDNVFVGFNSIIFNCTIERGCYIDVGATVTGGVKVPAYRYVPTGAIINTQNKANELERISETQQEFAKDVVEVNNEFADIYRRYYRDIYFNCNNIIQE